MNSKSKHKFEIKQIAIKNLSLWDENSRFPDYLAGSDERELVQTLLRKYELETFANEVVKDFDLPQLERIVVLKKGKKHIVLEGNRRLATYKCLLDPKLVENETIRIKFETLGTKIKLNDNFKFEAVVTNIKEDGLRFIERKHYHGNNEIDWGQYERDHHIRRTRQSSSGSLSAKEMRSIFRAKIGDMVRETALPEEMKRNILGKGFITTFYRVVNSEAGRKKLKYEKHETELHFEDKKEFLELLKIIIFNLLNKHTFSGEELNSRTLNDEEDIRKYLDSISSQDIKEVDRLIALVKKRGVKSERAGKTRGRKKKKKTVGDSLPFPIPKRKEYKFDQPTAIEIVNYILGKFSNVAERLKSEKRHGGKQILSIEDEYDVQYLLGALLRLFFDQVYPEEWTPSYLGKSKKIDFLIKDQKIVIETKMTSDKLRDNALVKQLVEDTHHYNASKDCEIFFCFIFDPEKQIKDPARIIADLERKEFTSLETFCIFAY